MRRMQRIFVSLKPRVVEKRLTRAFKRDCSVIDCYSPLFSRKISYRNRVLSLNGFLRPCLHGGGGPRSSGVGFFCFVSARAWRQKKPTPLDRGPLLHANRVLNRDLVHEMYRHCIAFFSKSTNLLLHRGNAQSMNEWSRLAILECPEDWESFFSFRVYFQF